MTTATRFLTGFLLGSLIGATAALLFAPASGDDLRHQIQGQVERVRNEVRQASADRRAELERELAHLRAPQRTIQI